MADEIGSDIEIIEDDEEKKTGLKSETFSALISIVLLSAIIFALSYYFIPKKYAIGPVLIILGFLPVIALKIFRKNVNSALADIGFGAIFTAVISIASSTGINIAGILGTTPEAAIIGIAIVNMIIICLAGLFEGKISQYLSRKNIDIERTPLSASIGKMSGCLFGIGIVLTVAWTIMGL